jgi:DNA primase
MNSSPIDEIKNRLDVVDIVKEYLKLEKAGINYRALCPFHSEKTPSFFVSPSRQMWHCFGSCSEGGDIFKFIMKIEGVEFGDALRILAGKAGIELQKQDPRVRTERQRMYEICEYATCFFERNLKDPSAKKIKNYLLERGIKSEDIENWRIGYSLDSWDSLINFLSDKGYHPKEIEKAGLAVKKDGTNRYYDRFRERIMFPIFDLGSQPIGFGGRIFDPENKDPKKAKYLNTSNTLIYDKSKVLYGLNKAKTEARKKGACVLVEGYTDVIMSHQAGIENVVATSGTAMTFYQLKTLKRYCDELIMAFDMDIAGDSATKRGIEAAQVEDFNIKIALMPKNLDPAELICQNPSNWEKTIKEAIPIVSFYFQSAFSKFDPEIPENKKKIACLILPIIKKINSDIEKDFWIKKLAEKLEVGEDAVIQDLAKTKVEETDLAQEKKNILPKKQRKELLEERFLVSIIKKKNFNFLNPEDLNFFSNEARKIINCFGEGKEKETSSEIKEKIDYLRMRSDIELEKIDCEKEIINCLSEIKIIGIKNELNEISKQIKEAEKEKNFDKAEKLKKEFNSSCRKLADIA